VASPWDTESAIIGEHLKQQPDAPAAPLTADPDQAAITHALANPNTVVNPNTGQPAQVPAGNPLIDFKYGLGRPFDTAATLLDRGVAAIAPEGSGVQQWAQGDAAEIAKRAQAYKDFYGGNPPASSPQRDLGEALPMAAASLALPYSTGAFWPRLASNATGGAISGLLTGDPNASASKLGSEALEGGGLGAAAALGTGTAARVAYPAMARPGSDVRTLMDIGVRPTPGQAMGAGDGWFGRSANRIEQGLGSIPIIGDFLSAARGRSVQQYNMGLMNDWALAPIGERLDATAPGRPAVAEMANRISAAYQRAVPTAGGTVDAQVGQDLARIQANASMLPPDRAQQFNNFMDQYVTRRIDPNGTMTGQSFKDAESDLGKAASGYLYNPNSDTDARMLGQHLRDAQGALREWLARVTPQNADDIRAANLAYARQMRIENAAARPGAEPGIFSPAQFQASVAANATRGQVARGTAMGQDISDAGRAVLGATVPDSGTPFRHAVGLGGALLAGKELGVSELPLEYKLAMLGGATAAGAVYNPLGQRVVAHMMATRYPWQENIATGARALSPVIAGAAPPGLLQ
jgi:hypothetical protein